LKTYLTLKNLITQNNINHFLLKMFLITMIKVECVNVTEQSTN